MDAPPLRPPASAASLPRSEPHRRLWGPVTVRAAWELLLAGVQVRGPILRAAREHAFLLIPGDANLPEAEALAAAATRDLLQRQRGVYGPWSVDPDLAILPDPRWAEEIARYADDVHDSVFRLHFADGIPLEEIERRRRIDRSALRAAKGALIELAREVLLEDGVPVHDWDTPRMERLLARIATSAGDLCPGPGGLATDPGKAHAEHCPRCSRALRLLREGVLSPSDLFAPEDGPLVGAGSVDVLVVQLHPDHRRHRKELASALGPSALPVNRESWVVPLEGAPEILDDLRALAEDAAPAASMLRIRRCRLAGRITEGAVLGPAVLDVLEALHRQEWGSAVGIDPLPEPLPPPPSAARWWMTAAVVGLLALAAGTWALLPSRADADVPLEATRDAAGVVFDTDDEAYVDLLALRGGTLSLVLHSVTPLDKAELATRDGRYRVALDADVVFLVARSSRLDGVEALVGGLSGVPADRDEVRRRLLDRFPRAAVATVP